MPNLTPFSSLSSITVNRFPQSVSTITQLTPHVHSPPPQPGKQRLRPRCHPEGPACRASCARHRCRGSWRTCTRKAEKNTRRHVYGENANAFKRLSNPFKLFPNAFERVCVFSLFIIILFIRKVICICELWNMKRYE